MKVKFTFDVPFTKVVCVDLSSIEIKSNDILIKDLDFNSFTTKELNAMANTSGYNIDFYGEDFFQGKSRFMRIYAPKGYCHIDFMADNEYRVKYLTNEIDKMSAELNKLIN